MDKEFEMYQEQQLKQRGFSDSAVSAIKRRINLQAIGTFLRDGSTKTTTCFDSFEKRESMAFSKLSKQIEQNFSNGDKEEILDLIEVYTEVVSEIYFNLGMKTGATLQIKLLDNFETDI